MNHQTSESIAAERAYQQAQRQLIAQQTGVVITDAGVQATPRIVLIPCLTPGCWYVAGGADESEAFEKLERHLRRRHGIQVPKEVA